MTGRPASQQRTPSTATRNCATVGATASRATRAFRIVASWTERVPPGLLAKGDIVRFADIGVLTVTAVTPVKAMCGRSSAADATPGGAR